MTKKRQKVPLTPKVTFVGGKWYDERGREVPKPQPQPRFDTPSYPGVTSPVSMAQQQGQLQRYDDDALYERLANCTCTAPRRTGHVPGCVHFADALYVCERADREHITALAKLAETTVADLERRRIDFAQPDGVNGPSSTCPELIVRDDGRRRCWRCPYWNQHQDETPFDYQKAGP